MRQTSLMAFEEIRPHIGKQETEVLECIKEHQPICDRDISYETGIEKTSVCGRRNSLYKKGFIRVSHVDTDPTTGKQVTLWMVCNI